MILASCGGADSASETKIVGGTSPDSDDAVIKHTVALVDPTGEQFCTGTLVTSTWVVTAAHCLADYRDDALYIAFGKVAKLGHFTREKLRGAAFAKVHEDFNPLALRLENPSFAPADIALVVLSEPAPEGHEPVAVMRAHNETYVGETLLLAGYGVTSGFGGSSGDLLKVETTLISKSADAKEFDFGESPGRSACRGDSGGPAFVYRGNQLALLGVTSRGSYFCNNDGTYTDIRYYIDWIIETGREGSAAATAAAN